MHSDRVGTVIKACEEVEDSEERGGIRMVGGGVGVNTLSTAPRKDTMRLIVAATHWRVYAE